MKTKATTTLIESSLGPSAYLEAYLFQGSSMSTKICIYIILVKKWFILNY